LPVHICKTLAKGLKGWILPDNPPSSLAFELAHKHLNPKWAKVLKILGLDIDFVRAKGSCLYDAEGERYLDFHTGEGVASLGHNNPSVSEAVKQTIDADLASGVQIHYNALAGQLAHSLCQLTNDRLTSVFFANSGAEIVEAAIKFSRHATGRATIVSCEESFHGLTMGALSIGGEEYFKEGFGPLLQDCTRVPFDDLDALESILQRRDAAAFIVEPIQGRTVRIPGDEYFRGAQKLCRKYGTMFVLDEIQTGLGRTGKMLAGEHWGLDPDVLLLAKALSGGVIPIGAMLYRKSIYEKTFTSLRTSYIHHSTFGRNNLAMAAGIAALDDIKRNDLVGNAYAHGRVIQDRLLEMKQEYDLVHEVRGLGLMFAIELGQPKSMKLKLQWKAIRMGGAGLFAQVLIRPLLVKHRIVCMVSGENDVIKFLPPINISSEEVDYFLSALDDVLKQAHDGSSSIWGDLLRMGKLSVGL
jgi:ornithine--oxo-acid transaminase